MFPKTNTQIQQQNFIRQIKQYMISLQQTITKLLSVCNYCRKTTKNPSPLKQIQLLIQKLQLQIQKYRECIRKIQNKVMSKGGLNSIKNYLTNNYNVLIRQCYQLISMCGNQVKLPKEGDFRKIKEFQDQMDSQWVATDKNQRNQDQTYNSRLKTHFVSISSKQNDSSNDNNIYKQATAQIQQQFLAIRLIAYKMYQKYNTHQHQKLHTQLQILKQQQSKLSKQITQMKQTRMQLLQEQQKLQTQLLEIKKINQLIGRRYFVENSRIDTNFTTN